MTWPIQPTDAPIPWSAASGSGNRAPIDPAQIDTGWHASGLGATGQKPPYQWVNTLDYNQYLWNDYAKRLGVYLQNGGARDNSVLLTNCSGASSSGSESTIIFNSIVNINNISSVYNTSTGVFTAPVSALYDFYLDVLISTVSINNTPIVMRDSFAIIYTINSSTPVELDNLLIVSNTTVIERALSFSKSFYLNLNSGDTVLFKISCTSSNESTGGSITSRSTYIPPGVGDIRVSWNLGS